MVWFEFLRQHGFFNPASNPGPIAVDDGFKIPYWSSLAYLEKLADQIKEGHNLEAISDIIEIIEQVSKEPKDNYMTWFVFIKILAKLPNDSIPVTILHHIPTWFKSRFDTMSQSQGLYEDLLPKFLNTSPTADDIKKAEIILDYAFTVHRHPEKYESHVDENLKSFLHPYTFKEISNNDGLLVNIVNNCSIGVISKVAQNTKSLLLDYPQGIIEFVSSGEVDYRVRVLIVGENLKIVWKINSDEEQEKELDVVEDYESKSKQELKNIFRLLLGRLPTSPDQENLSWSVYRIVSAVKVDMFSAIIHHPIHELEIDNNENLPEIFTYLLRQLLVVLAKEKPNTCKEFIAMMAYSKSYHYPFFRRLVFYLTAENYDLFKDIFWNLIDKDDPELFFSEDMYYPDLNYLFEKNSQNLTQDNIDILEAIINHGSQDENGENNDKYQAYWRFGWYTALKHVPYFANEYEAYSKKAR